MNVSTDVMRYRNDDACRRSRRLFSERNVDSIALWWFNNRQVSVVQVGGEDEPAQSMESVRPVGRDAKDGERVDPVPPVDTLGALDAPARADRELVREVFCAAPVRLRHSTVEEGEGSAGQRGRGKGSE